MYTTIAAFVLMIANFLVTYKGLKDRHYFEEYNFEIDKILKEKDYKRLVTSGFLHVNWLHFAFNMASLYFFSDALELYSGFYKMLIIYFASLVGGNLLSLYIHRNHGNYRAVGASGAVSGIIFASIALFPDLEVGFFMLPTIPSWGYAILFVAISIFGIKSQTSSIGHDAHLGGALVGLITALIMSPEVIGENYIPILCIVVPTVAFIYYIVSHPAFLLKKGDDEDTPYETIEDRYNARKAEKQNEVDRILDKINRKGMDSLSEKEKEILKNMG